MYMCVHVCSTQSRNLHQSPDCTLGLHCRCACNRSCKPRLPFKFPPCILVTNVHVCKELLQLYRLVLKPHVPETSGKFANLEKLPSPRSWYGRSKEIPDLWSAPVQGFTNLESSQLSSVSQLRHSHPLVCYIHELHSRNLEIAPM